MPCIEIETTEGGAGAAWKNIVNWVLNMLILKCLQNIQLDTWIYKTANQEREKCESQLNRNGH